MGSHRDHTGYFPHCPPAVQWSMVCGLYPPLWSLWPLSSTCGILLSTRWGHIPNNQAGGLYFYIGVPGSCSTVVITAYVVWSTRFAHIEQNIECSLHCAAEDQIPGFLLSGEPSPEGGRGDHGTVIWRTVARGCLLGPGLLPRCDCDQWF